MSAVSANQYGAKHKASAMILRQSGRMRGVQKRPGTAGTRLARSNREGRLHRAMVTAKLLTGHEHDRDAVYRVNHTVPYNACPMDDTRKILDLKGLGHSNGRDRPPVLEPVFFDAPAEEFTPVYDLNEDFHDD